MFIVNLSKGTAIKQYVNCKNALRIKNYAIFLDNDGAYILTKEKKIYLTEENSLFI